MRTIANFIVSRGSKTFLRNICLKNSWQGRQYTNPYQNTDNKIPNGINKTALPLYQITLLLCTFFYLNMHVSFKRLEEEVF